MESSVLAVTASGILALDRTSILAKNIMAAISAANYFAGGGGGGREAEAGNCNPVAFGWNRSARQRASEAGRAGEGQ